MSLGRRLREPSSAVSPGAGADSPVRALVFRPPRTPPTALIRFDQFSQLPVESPSGGCSGPVHVLFTAKPRTQPFFVLVVGAGIIDGAGDVGGGETGFQGR